jgi:hypothetical protein
VVLLSYLIRASIVSFTCANTHLLIPLDASRNPQNVGKMWARNVFEWFRPGGPTPLDACRTHGPFGSQRAVAMRYQHVAHARDRQIAAALSKMAVGM